MYLKYLKNKLKGLSLIELLTTLAINVVILAALLAVFSSHIGSFNQASNADNLNQQLQFAMEIMANDIRRAGYWANAKDDIDTNQNDNPFMVAGSTDVTLPSSSCILFTYDHGNTGTLPAISSGNTDDDRYGFRLNANTIQSRPPGAAFSCGAAANVWENLTDPNIVRITNLSFTLSSTTVPVGQANPTMTLRTITISLTGQLTSDATVTKTLTQQVRIR